MQTSTESKIYVSCSSDHGKRLTPGSEIRQVGCFSPTTDCRNSKEMSPVKESRTPGTKQDMRSGEMMKHKEQQQVSNRLQPRSAGHEKSTSFDVPADRDDLKGGKKIGDGPNLSRQSNIQSRAASQVSTSLHTPPIAPSVEPSGERPKYGNSGVAGKSIPFVARNRGRNVRGEEDGAIELLQIFAESSPFVMSGCAMRSFSQFSCSKDVHMKWTGRPLTLDFLLTTEELHPPQVGHLSVSVSVSQ